MAGKIDEKASFAKGDFRDIVPRFSPEALVDLVARIAAAKNVTPARMALAWMLSQKTWIVPIRALPSCIASSGGGAGRAGAVREQDDLMAESQVLRGESGAALEQLPEEGGDALQYAH